MNEYSKGKEVVDSMDHADNGAQTIWKHMLSCVDSMVSLKSCHCNISFGAHCSNRLVSAI